ncbi:MAG: glycoside hydrolase family 97 N-terminal domain-containing protein [Verrucomicrobiota bacterium]
MNLRIASTSLFLRVSGFLRRLGFWTLPLFVLSATWDRAEEYTLTSPDGNLRVLLKDGDGIRYTLQIGGSVVLTESRLGLRFQDGTTWGPKTHFVGRVTSAADTTWDNPFGKDRLVRDHYNELSLSTSTSGSPLDPTLIVRAYNDGLAFRYRMPAKGQLTIIAADLSTYHFAGDYPCWAGTPSNCAESTYSQTTVDHLPAGKNVAPVLVQTPSAYVALCEADLRKWAGSFFSGGGTGADLNSVQVVLSPWHVIMAGETMSDLFESELINNLATPSRLQDITWIKPGITAWDPWWPGVEVPGAPAHGDNRANAFRQGVYRSRLRDGLAISAH